jgi:hypothetical protein
MKMGENYTQGINFLLIQIAYMCSIKLYQQIQGQNSYATSNKLEMLIHVQ